MTSALRDAGIGVDGGDPVDRCHSADSGPNVSIHRSASPSPWTARIDRPRFSDLDEQAR
jgi:hypothetical protein